jgi:hypothetical protein
MAATTAARVSCLVVTPNIAEAIIQAHVEQSVPGGL